MSNAMVRAADVPRTMTTRDETGFSESEIDLIKTQIAPGCTDGELQLFLHVCKSRGLDPFARQIYAIRRKSWDAATRTEVWRMTIQTAIDGFRLTAKRAGNEAIDEAEFEYDAATKSPSNPLGLVKATVRVWPKQVSRPTVGVAYWDEYRQATKEGKLTGQWGSMPRTMLAKCAEAQALRKAYPEELSGLYTHEEMGQADNEPQAVRRASQTPANAASPVAYAIEPDPDAMLADSIQKRDFYAHAIANAQSDAELAQVAADVKSARGIADPHMADIRKAFLTRQKAIRSRPAPATEEHDDEPVEAAQ